MDGKEDLTQVPLEFENDVAFDDNNQMQIRIGEEDTPLEAEGTPVEEVIEESTTEEVVGSQSLAAPSELDVVKAQLDALKQDLQIKNQLLSLVKQEMENQVKSKQEIPAENLLETFADTEKGMKFLDSYVGKKLEIALKQALQPLTPAVNQLEIKARQDNFRSNHPEAFQAGPDGKMYLRPEVYKDMEPLLTKYKDMNWDDAYAPFKKHYMANKAANKTVITTKAQKLKNVNNTGQASGMIAGKDIVVNSVADALKLAEQQLMNKK